MAKGQGPLGRVELAILQFVVDHHPISVREVADYASKTTGQARTTVLTMMERLRKKGYLRRRKVKGVNRYSPSVSRPELLQTLVRDFVEGVLGGSVSPLFAYLTKSTRLNEEEMAELREVLKELESREPE